MLISIVSDRQSDRQTDGMEGLFAFSAFTAIAIQGEPSPPGPGFGWVDFEFGYFTVCPIMLGAWADHSLAEWAEQLGKMGGTSKSM